jgi:hypothetical protein
MLEVGFAYMVRLPPGAEEHLRSDHPRLLELRERYARYSSNFQHTQWSPDVLAHELDLKSFRADNAYNWQVRGNVQEIQYLLTAYYAREMDSLRIFGGLFEDDYFGAHTFAFNGTHLLSRDLLDSVIQINFLHRHTNLGAIPGGTVLDIGAGYGRLPWRMSRALPNLAHIWCTDGVPESTFLCEYYLTFRRADERVNVFPLDEVADRIRGQHIHVVSNVQSFTECTSEAIAWWMNTLDTATVDYLFIVPNTPDQLLSMDTDGVRRDFLPVIEAHGFRLIAKEFAYHGAPSVQQHGVYGALKFWLFARS